MKEGGDDDGGGDGGSWRMVSAVIINVNLSPFQTRFANRHTQIQYSTHISFCDNATWIEADSAITDSTTSSCADCCCLVGQGCTRNSSMDHPLYLTHLVITLHIMPSSQTLLPPMIWARSMQTTKRALPRPSVVQTCTRTVSSTASRPLAQPPSQSQTESEELNEAQRYLANKAARKTQRASNPTGASARHASLYSQLFPALLRILAYGSSAYFGLHLLWNILDRDEQTQLMTTQTSALESTARSIAAKVDEAVRQADPAASSSNTQENSKAKRSWYWPF
ncbi:hypothetical protein PHSY_001218 [Pseudozyma hubeiensis SY62]|uniref:Uncharacterized protein n=1 Tax=Pseudozyma hubeiensis (strain SY62) TaxID=1305764 RepID=R9NY28_PSEHS|nr:hypothetical protein PHSY_001218 [Pseudozyma hubeiensis SY62]GAC93653.1 hypothetical protein PHSY_001218 [Pseudozyma hubeiensis SY62]